MDTKKILITYDALADFKKSLLAALPGGLLAAACLYVGSFPESHTKLKSWAPQYLWHFYSTEGPAAFCTFALLLVAGIAAALFQYRFLGSRRQTNVLLSAGLSRRQLYKNRCVSAAIALFSGVFLPLTMTLLVNVRYFGLRGCVFQVYLLYVVSTFTVALIGYTAGLFCVVLAGTTYEAAAAAPLILSFPFLLIAFFVNCCGVFLNGYGAPADYYNQFTYQKYYYLNPLTILGCSDDGFYSDNLLWTRFSMAIDFGNKSETAVLKSLPVFFGWIAVCILGLFLSRHILDRRRAELNGFGRRSKAFAAIVISFFMFLTAAAALYFFVVRGISYYSFYDYPFNDDSKIFAAFTFWEKLLTLCALLLPALTSLCVGLFVYSGSLKSFHNRLKLLPLSLLVLVLPVICLLGGLGWAGNVPDIEQIESIDLGSVFLPANGVLYNNTSDLLRGFESDGDKRLITQLHRQLLKEARGENARGINIVYTLKNGRELRRTYFSCTDETLRGFTDLFDGDTMEKYLYEQFGDKSAWLSDSDYMDAMSAAGLAEENSDYVPPSFFLVQDVHGNRISLARAREMDWLGYGAGEITLVTPRGVFADITDRLTQVTLDRLMRCIAHDLVDMSAEEFYTPDEQTLAVLSITDFDYTNSYYDGADPYDYYFNITTNMTRTVAF